MLTTNSEVTTKETVQQDTETVYLSLQHWFLNGIFKMNMAELQYILYKP